MKIRAGIKGPKTRKIERKSMTPKVFFFFLKNDQYSQPPLATEYKKKERQHRLLKS